MKELWDWIILIVQNEYIIATTSVVIGGLILRKLRKHISYWPSHLRRTLTNIKLFLNARRHRAEAIDRAKSTYLALTRAEKCFRINYHLHELSGVNESHLERYGKMVEELRTFTDQLHNKIDALRSSKWKGTSNFQNPQVDGRKRV